MPANSLQCQRAKRLEKTRISALNMVLPGSELSCSLRNSKFKVKRKMTTLKTSLLAAVACIGLLGAVSQASAAQPAACTSYAKVKLGVSIYVGWQPWYWANQTGLIQAEGKKRCLDIEVQEFTDYGASIDAYTAGQLDALTITNMDAMMSPVNSGVDTTAIIVGDYSNGNDAILSKDATSVKDLKGKQIFRLQQSVTDYLIERALEKNGMTAADIDLRTCRTAPMSALSKSQAEHPQHRHLESDDAYDRAVRNRNGACARRLQFVRNPGRNPGLARGQHQDA